MLKFVFSFLSLSLFLSIFVADEVLFSIQTSNNVYRGVFLRIPTRDQTKAERFEEDESAIVTFLGCFGELEL